jgi:hypothetical protein
MKEVVVRVSINKTQENDLGNRWRDGQTTVFLIPSAAGWMGKWSSNRPNDITEHGSDDAEYIWSGGKYLDLYSGGSLSSKGTKHLTLNRFKMKVGESDDGIFHFRSQKWKVSWEVVELR